jgi:hypothetical protein
MRQKSWIPEIGAVVQYAGRHSTLSRSGHTARVVAEGVRGYFVVEVIGRRGAPVRVTVKAASLAPLGPCLF